MAHPFDATSAGVLLSVEFLLSGTTTDTPQPSRRPTVLPGLVGTASAWRRCCDDLAASYCRGDWVALSGESGVGKHALAMAVHHYHHPGVWAYTFNATSDDDEGLAELAQRLRTETHRRPSSCATSTTSAPLRPRH